MGLGLKDVEDSNVDMREQHVKTIIVCFTMIYKFEEILILICIQTTYASVKPNWFENTIIT